MAGKIHANLHKSEDPNLSHYVGFILRCWTGQGEQIHARLVEVHSEASHTVADLNKLLALVHRLVTEALSLAPDTDAEMS